MFWCTVHSTVLSCINSGPLANVRTGFIYAKMYCTIIGRSLNCQCKILAELGDQDNFCINVTARHYPKAKKLSPVVLSCFFFLNAALSMS